jgi:hypothetical protein
MRYVLRILIIRTDSSGTSNAIFLIVPVSKRNHDWTIFLQSLLDASLPPIAAVASSCCRYDRSCFRDDRFNTKEAPNGCMPCGGVLGGAQVMTIHAAVLLVITMMRRTRTAQLSYTVVPCRSKINMK